MENLVAEGFGTLTTAEVQDVEGAGSWDNGQWRVLFIRDFEPADPELASFDVGETTSVAFAVWNGNQGDRNGQKSIAPFIELQLVDETAARSVESASSNVLPAILTIAAALLVAYVVYRRTEKALD